MMGHTWTKGAGGKLVSVFDQILDFSLKNDLQNIELAFLPPYPLQPLFRGKKSGVNYLGAN